MANTNTITNVAVSPDLCVVRFLCASDGSEETDLVVYDSSVIATALGKADTLKCRLEWLKYTAIKASTNVSTLIFEYDATTDVIALPISIPPTGQLTGEFSTKEFGSNINLANGTAGATGDIVLTTTNMDAGDKVLIVMGVRPY